MMGIEQGLLCKDQGAARQQPRSLGMNCFYCFVCDVPYHIEGLLPLTPRCWNALDLFMNARVILGGRGWDFHRSSHC